MFFWQRGPRSELQLRLDASDDAVTCDRPAHDPEQAAFTMEVERACEEQARTAPSIPPSFGIDAHELWRAA